MEDNNKSKPHESAVGHVTGKAIYTDDQRLPNGMLYLWPVLSPYAKAKILKIDSSNLDNIPGLITILTANDIKGNNNTGTIKHDEVLLPTDEINYWGQPVVWVVAETENTAQKAAETIKIDYEVLTPILTIKDAIKNNSVHADKNIMRRGNITSALQESEFILTGEIEIPGQDHFYLETQVSWVIPNVEDNYQVYASTQHPSETQAIISEVLGIPRNQIVVTCLRMGGGFGGKETQANPTAAIAALAAQKTGCPARVRLKRDQDMITTGKRHPFLCQYQVGFNSKGQLLALDIDLYSDGGWSADLSFPILQRAMFHLDNCYYIPNLEIRGQVLKTNKVSNTAFRGFGGPQGMAIIEEIIGRIARKLGLPPELVRERNFYHGEAETNTTHYGQEIFDNRILRVWEEVKLNSNFAERKIEIAQFNQNNNYQKRGLAITPVKFGISFTKTEYNQGGALILIYLDGSIQLNHGGTEMGQGLQTKMLQVACQSLGVNIERFRIMPTSTDKVPNTSATAASSGSDLNGQAIKNACEILKKRLAKVAAKLLNLDEPQELVFEQDWIYCQSYPSQRIAFNEVVKQAYNQRVSLSTTGYYRTPNIYYDPKIGKGRPFYYYAYGAAVSEVEIDGFTGTFKLRQVDIVHDVGESLNPLIDRGQIEGGFVQGMGWLTMEELIWDDSGRLKTFAPSTYKIPTIKEVPKNFKVDLLKRAAQDGVIYGSKAVGEPPFMLAISVREAIKEAIAAFGKTDSVFLASPATPEAILNAIEQVQLNSVYS
ncbi:xanthine dehydrogenase molybdopterin binding subunit [Planktothrix paucivesiculata]|uniref:Xanthine dehydrogenase, molybdenum binding subunit apoprotein n=1 Tax=Planktothrix paucivesiculata PCC 9631 TaxID=671071 RepID=A0A7Z9BT05_9CYAN|nr:xanthine dehydrogenase molybdopterin binding subunit [Planktothrix paucivesiculata]VXD21771.1 Xanthine dehydrogenase, molybdenum binding subunit apoprotein [Planktothrix paucivesiculata PCC 9631]